MRPTPKSNGERDILGSGEGVGDLDRREVAGGH
jgi:hypothetical protein